jgi:hypothetical protein
MESHAAEQKHVLSLTNRMRLERGRRWIANHPVRTLVGYIVTVIVVGGALYSLLEEDANWIDGMWWAVVTASTVGYGDISPAHVEGRLLAGWIILSGIATTALLTGLLAAWVLGAKLEEHLGTPDLHDDFDHLIGQLQALKRRYEQDETGDDAIADAARAAYAEWQTEPGGEKCNKAMATLAEALKHDY